jgi:hypothetical protein
MDPHDGAVDHRIFVVGIGREMLENPPPYAGFGPAAEAPMHVLPIAKTLRQITPGYPSPVAIEYSLDEQAVVGCSYADRPFTPRQQVLDPVPLVVAKSIAAHRSAFRS